MDDLLAVEPDHRSELTVEHVRVLRLIRRGGGVGVKLPLRFKHERGIIDKLCEAGLVLRQESGWPGVPGYTLTSAGMEMISGWLAAQRYRVVRTSSGPGQIVTR